VSYGLKITGSGGVVGLTILASATTPTTVRSRSSPLSTTRLPTTAPGGRPGNALAAIDSLRTTGLGSGSVEASSWSNPSPATRGRPTARKNPFPDVQNVAPEADRSSPPATLNLPVT
jgi:hypothetical protein